MRTVPIRLCLAVGLFAALATSAVDLSAQATLRHYRLLPGYSTLSQTYGGDGFTMEMSVFGFLGLADTTPIPNADGFARLVDVYAWGAHPLMFPGLSLDGALDLTNVYGGLLYRDAGLDIFQFERSQGDRAIHFLAATWGPWFYLRGETGEEFEGPMSYDFRLLGRQVPHADFQEDAFVDERDLAAWSAAFGTTPSPEAAAGYPLHADADADFDVDGADFLAWQQQLGSSVTPIDFERLIDQALGDVAAVPEPAALAIAATLGAAAVRRRKAAARDASP